MGVNVFAFLDFCRYRTTTKSTGEHTHKWEFSFCLFGSVCFTKRHLGFIPESLGHEGGMGTAIELPIRVECPIVDRFF